MSIPLETLKRVEVIYTHAHCPDGMATAMILKDAFSMLGMKPRIEFLVHNTPEHRQAWSPVGDGTVALFCDIAPHLEAVETMNGRSGDVVVLDHHKGAEGLVHSFGEFGVFADEKLEPGVSGAVLAFREVWEPICAYANPPLHRTGNSPIREFAEACGARDCVVKDHPLFWRGQYISKMLMSKPAEWWLESIGASSFERIHGNIRDACPYLTETEVEIGRVLFESHAEAVRQATEQLVIYDVGDDSGSNVLLYVFQDNASGFRLTTDVAIALQERMKADGNDAPAVLAGFFYGNEPNKDPRLTYSLRGLNGFDVAAFAKANGGGGHTLAAGFSIAETDMGPYEDIAWRLDNFIAPKDPWVGSSVKRRK